VIGSVESPGRSRRRSAVLAAIYVALALCLVPVLFAQEPMAHAVAPRVRIGLWDAIRLNLPVYVIVIIGCCVAMSAFFSGSEAAFFSIHRVRLRSMAEEESGTGRLVARLMEHPGRLLTTLLVGNTVVNILFTLMLGTRIDNILLVTLEVSELSASLMSIGLCTAVLVFFGEIMPKVTAVSASESAARIVVVPLMAIDRILSPLCKVILALTDFIFRITNFHSVRAAPFITDDELKAVFEAREAKSVIQEDERQMIQGILEFNDVLLREIVVPRPDVVALPEDSTVADALELHRKHEYSRMPVFRDDLDHVMGILIVKDLLPFLAKGDLTRTVRTLVKPAHFVPETMTIQQFVKDAQRHRAHLAVVVDEYGGTAGIVALEDAFEEVVGDIRDEMDEDEHLYTKLADGEYRVDGRLSIEELAEFIGVPLEDDEHETVAGFLMNHTDKILEPGDQFEHSKVLFHVESCEGKRAQSVKIKVLQPAPAANAEEPAP
jgi:putative hemolysin